MKRYLFSILLILLASCVVASPTPFATPSLTPTQTPGLLRVLAVESFLADIAQNVAGDRLTVETLLPLGVDPHAYQPTPRDVAKVADSDVLIVNGAGIESYLDSLLANAGGQRLPALAQVQVVITASAGLTPRPDPQGEHPEGDPHFWLDPNNVIAYVENIRNGLSQVDPDGASVYAANAAAYIEQLKALDQWITQQVATVQPARRLLVTNHESLGYFADRYGFTVVGAVIPSVSTEASPTAQQMAALIEQIKASGAPAIFLETGANPQLAQQIAAETGVKVVTDLYTHSLSAPDGPAPTYIDMMKYNVSQIVTGCQS
jgi:ABC-type Zn uptake system ZnuABC Zn-binding protein ZnuA